MALNDNFHNVEKY